MLLGFQSTAELLLKFPDHPRTLSVVLANAPLIDSLLCKLVLLIQSSSLDLNLWHGRWLALCSVET